jgi:hypothetical protein
MRVAILRFFLIAATSLLMPALRADVSSEAENFVEFMRGFCATEKAWHAQYAATIQPISADHPLLKVETKATAEINYLCPSQLRIKIEAALFKYELISDGVQAWVIYKPHDKPKSYIEQYNSLNGRELGDWLASIGEMISAKAGEAGAVLAKKNLLIHYIPADKIDKTDALYSVSLPKDEKKLELAMSSVPNYKLKLIRWQNHSLKMELKLDKILSKSEALDAKTYFYFQKNDDLVNVISEQ